MTSHDRDWAFGGPEAEIDVLVEPTPGHTTDEVARRLREEGASDVVVLSPGFISATAPKRVLAAVEPIARAHPKITKRLHSPR